ncbi:hypothetical protein [Heliophilum fasciatum]|uniref:hypothetical protein n=1 Tax=Heliophilum fasciatum TaxID=35700 RepID=UPI00140528A5|nr:hypothetical protein [Heliophilum fasciatum]MCW2276878.1 hypothetical protein [Heliophilum fasciatum]
MNISVAMQRNGNLIYFCRFSVRIYGSLAGAMQRTGKIYIEGISKIRRSKS